MGEWTDKVEGKVKEVTGSVTGDDSKQAEGKAQGTWGNVEGKGNDIKDSIGNAADEFSGNNRDRDTTVDTV